MKRRKGYVSNSSSSSFICDVCGEECSGWDVSMQEAEMALCTNGHTVCLHHIKHDIDINTLTKEEYAVQLADNYYNDKIIKNIKNMTDDEYKQWLKTDDAKELFEQIKNELEIPVKYCPICSLNKITNNMLLDYLIACDNVNREIIKAEIKEKFNNYDELYEFIKTRE